MLEVNAPLVYRHRRCGVQTEALTIISGTLHFSNTCTVETVLLAGRVRAARLPVLEVNAPLLDRHWRSGVQKEALTISSGTTHFSSAVETVLLAGGVRAASFWRSMVNTTTVAMSKWPKPQLAWEVTRQDSQHNKFKQAFLNG